MCVCVYIYVCMYMCVCVCMCVCVQNLIDWKYLNNVANYYKFPLIC